MIASSITDENFNSEFKTIEDAQQAIINEGVYDEYVILLITELRVVDWASGHFNNICSYHSERLNNGAHNRCND
jgi:hypothetical protein